MKIVIEIPFFIFSSFRPRYIYNIHILPFLQYSKTNRAQVLKTMMARKTIKDYINFFPRRNFNQLYVCNYMPLVLMMQVIQKKTGLLIMLVIDLNSRILIKGK